MFKKSQAILKIFLSEKNFNRAYNIAWRIYLIWVDIKDKIHFGVNKNLALLTRNKEKIIKNAFEEYNKKFKQELIVKKYISFFKKIIK